MGNITIDVPEDNGDKLGIGLTVLKQSGGYVVQFVTFTFTG